MVSVGIGILSLGVVLRILSTIAIAVGDKLNLKEKVYQLSNQRELSKHSARFQFHDSLTANVNYYYCRSNSK